MRTGARQGPACVHDPVGFHVNEMCALGESGADNRIVHEDVPDASTVPSPRSTDNTSAGSKPRARVASPLMSWLSTVLGKYSPRKPFRNEPTVPTFNTANPITTPLQQRLRCGRRGCELADPRHDDLEPGRHVRRLGGRDADNQDRHTSRGQRSGSTETLTEGCARMHTQRLPIDPEQVIACADHAMRSGEFVDDPDVGTDEYRAVARHTAGATAVVIVLTRASDRRSQPVLHAVSVILHQGSDGVWSRPGPDGLLGATRWADEARTRAARSWPGWGVVVSPSQGGHAPGTADAVPETGLSWITGVASKAVTKIRVQSTLGAAVAEPNPDTGAFVAFLEAPWREEVQAVATLEDGSEIDVMNQPPDLYE